MNDRELLEMAAKAAEIEIAWTDDVWNAPELPPYMHLPGGMLWNPLTDDGDALRLAVKLQMSMDHNHTADQQRYVMAERSGCEGCYAPVRCIEDEFDESGRLEATRRAIVRAAAEIGRQMP